MGWLPERSTTGLSSLQGINGQSPITERCDDSREMLRKCGKFVRRWHLDQVEQLATQWRHKEDAEIIRCSAFVWNRINSAWNLAAPRDSNPDC